MGYIVLVLLVFVVVYLVWGYNRLVKLRYRREEAYSGVDVQLKRRHDLIPNLVELVKGYSEHERETLEEVTRLRRESQGETDIKQRGEIEKTIATDMKKLLAVVEAYPELKADESFLNLHKTLVEVEDDLQYARRYFNATVRDFNILVESFPTNIVAGSFGFESAEFFEIDYATERNAPDVNFS